MMDFTHRWTKWHLATCQWRFPSNQKTAGKCSHERNCCWSFFFFFYACIKTCTCNAGAALPSFVKLTTVLFAKGLAFRSAAATSGCPLASPFELDINYRAAATTLRHSFKQTAWQPPAWHISILIWRLVRQSLPSDLGWLHLPDRSAQGWLYSFTLPSPADIKHLLLPILALLTDWPVWATRGPHY